MIEKLDSVPALNLILLRTFNNLSTYLFLLLKIIRRPILQNM